MNDILKLLSKNRLKVLMALKDEDLYIREISEKMGSSVASVHNTIKLLKSLDMAEEERVKNRKVISLKRENEFLKKIISMMNIMNISGLEGFKKLQRYGTVGIYGSYAEGTDTKNSDIDIWIFSEEADMLKLKEITRGMEKSLGKEINMTALTRRKIENLKRDDPEFYFRLRLKSIIFGDDPFD